MAQPLQAALDAPRARVRALEAQLALAGAADERAWRGASALAVSSEVAALRAEREAMRAALATAEKKLVLHERQQLSERERRASLAKALKRKDAALHRAEAESHALAAAPLSAHAAQLVEASVLRYAADDAADLALRVQAARAPLQVAVQLLAAELRAAEEGAAEKLAAVSEEYEGALAEALERAVQAEAQLAGELLASERTVVFLPE
ncbi:hypothetical protein AB1Y20_016717 [Prymnesium parvum]|uniref:Uncharacterized protein n=1 Tax=Prymnesium parvum TaxID=97485 RepID=A0AB34IAE7_PRYPA